MAVHGGRCPGQRALRRQPGAGARLPLQPGRRGDRWGDGPGLGAAAGALCGGRAAGRVSRRQDPGPRELACGRRPAGARDRPAEGGGAQVGRPRPGALLGAAGRLERGRHGDRAGAGHGVRGGGVPRSRPRSAGHGSGGAGGGAAAGGAPLGRGPGARSGARWRLVQGARPGAGARAGGRGGPGAAGYLRSPRAPGALRQDASAMPQRASCSPAPSRSWPGAGCPGGSAGCSSPSARTTSPWCWPVGTGCRCRAWR
jgi:hypothetical protein